jgi:methionyl-tRNA formyltransferase
MYHAFRRSMFAAAPVAGYGRSVGIVGGGLSGAPSLVLRKPPYRVLLFGSGPFAIPTLRALVAARSDSPSALVRSISLVTSHDHTTRTGSVKAIAESLHVPVFELPPNADFRLTGWPWTLQLPPHPPTSPETDFDVAVVMSFGYFLPRALIQAFTPAASAGRVMLNAHPSALPKFRGASPVPAALWAGEKSTAVTLIGIDPDRLDSGAILEQHNVVRRVALCAPVSLKPPFSCLC